MKEGGRERKRKYVFERETGGEISQKSTLSTGGNAEAIRQGLGGGEGPAGAALPLVADGAYTEWVKIFSSTAQEMLQGISASLLPWRNNRGETHTHTHTHTNTHTHAARPLLPGVERGGHRLRSIDGGRIAFHLPFRE